ncbi:MAG TPA: type II secretion system protein GspC [Gammaproteobacteria bacterium]|nr:type II secretion system protein GspC [Gammaproteobacteria bacterium]
MAEITRMLSRRLPLRLTPERGIRWAEAVLVVVLAVALANLVWDVVPAPGSGGAPGPAGHRSGGGSAAAPEGQAAPSLSAATRRLFGTAPTDKGTAEEAGEPVRETRLNLTLKGVLALEGSDRKLALIGRGGKDEEVYRVGDTVQGAEIVRIESRRVILIRNGVTEALNLKARKLKGGGGLLDTGGGSADPGIRRTGKHQRAVSRETLKRNLDNLPRLLQQAKAVPMQRNGQTVGFRVVNIQQGSVFQDLGVKEGDVIRSVNDTPIRSPKQALEAYRKLRSADAFRLDVLRDGQPVTLQYSVQ